MDWIEICAPSTRLALFHDPLDRHLLKHCFEDQVLSVYCCPDLRMATLS